MVKIADTSAQDLSLEPAPQRKRWLLIVMAMLTLGLCAWFAMPFMQRWTSAEQSVPAERLRFGEVQRGNFIRDISVQGRVVAAVSPTLYASQAGVVTFAVESGDSVKAGQEVAVIDSPEIENRLAQEKSRLISLQVELDRENIMTRQQKLQNQKSEDEASIALKAAQREMSRARRAFEQGAMIEVDYEKAQDELMKAELFHEHAVKDTELDNERLEFELRTRQLSLEQQQLLVADLQRQVGELSVLSPVSGIVGNLLVNQKTNVARNQSILSVVDLSAFEIEVQVSESYADDLAIGMLSEVRTGANQYDATLIAVSPEIIDNQVTGRIRFNGAVPAGLRQNQRLTTRILLEEKANVLMVPRGQFFDSGNGRVAYVVEDGVGTRRAIVTGASSLNQIEIIDGLSVGETIITSNTDAFDGAESVLINY